MDSVIVSMQKRASPYVSNRTTDYLCTDNVTDPPIKQLDVFSRVEPHAI